MPDHPDSGVEKAADEGRLGDLVWGGHPHGLLISDGVGAVLGLNPAARALLGGAGPRLRVPRELCRIVGCRRPGSALAGGCIHELAAASDVVLPEVRVDLAGEGGAGEAAWVTTAALPGAPGMLVTELRPGRRGDRRRRTEPHWVAGRRLRIVTLGRTRILGNEGPIEGRWLANRPGKILKLLLTHRHRMVHTDELTERLWPDNAGSSVEGLRYFMHVLRAELEPARRPREPSTFVVGEPGGYALNLGAISIDADEFEDHVAQGLGAARAGDDETARRRLEAGLDLYGGEFLAEEPYAEWAFEERDRLHDVAAEALRALVGIHRRAGAPEALRDLERLCALEPFDTEVHREFFALLIARGRRSEAVRRFGALRHRMLTTFGEDLDFTLADLARTAGRSDPPDAGADADPDDGAGLPASDYTSIHRSMAKAGPPSARDDRGRAARDATRGPSPSSP